MRYGKTRTENQNFEKNIDMKVYAYKKLVGMK
jgi:hypothetical protein